MNYQNVSPFNSTSHHTAIDGSITSAHDVSLVRVVSPVDLDLARKLVTGQRAFFFFGRNDVVGSTWVDIHPTSGDINWLSAATFLGIASSNTNDTSDGLGVRQIEIHGLSTTGVDQKETVTMNGTSEVTSALSYTRVNKFHNENVGTYGGSHRGDVTIRASSGGAGNGIVLGAMKGEEGTVDASVQYGSGEAYNGFWSVPLNKVAYITAIVVDVDTTSGNKTADVILYEREGLLNTTAPYDPRRVIWNTAEATGEVRKTFKSHIKIKQLTDMFFRAQASGAATKIAVSLDFYLLDRNSEGE